MSYTEFLHRSRLDLQPRQILDSLGRDDVFIRLSPSRVHDGARRMIDRHSVIKRKAKPDKTIKDVGAADEVRENGHRIEATKYVKWGFKTSSIQCLPEADDAVATVQKRDTKLFFGDTNHIKAREFVDRVDKEVDIQVW